VTTPRWGAPEGEGRRSVLVDLLLAAGVVCVAAGLFRLAGSATRAHVEEVEVDLSPWMLPLYTFFSLTRGLIAFALSVLFTLAVGYWAAKDRLAARVLVPLLDVLQSIPVLGFMPGLVLALVALFPRSNVGLEIACVLMIFTGQVWNMTFSFYHSVRAVPGELQEAATIYGFSAWRRFRLVELPYSMIGLVWNGMMSLAGGWFFLTVVEAFPLGEKNFRLPGLGSYVSVAVQRGDVPAMLCGVVAMMLMIVGLDQLLWRPVVVWAQRFRVEEGGAQVAPKSWFLDLLRRSHLLSLLKRESPPASSPAPADKPAEPRRPTRRAAPWAGYLSLPAFVVLTALLLWGAFQLIMLMLGKTDAPGDAVTAGDWGRLGGAALVTLVRVLVTTALATLWAVPVGLWIGLSPRLSNLLQPVVQVLASFPAPMLFPIVIAVLHAAGVSLGWGSILLMLLGTQWYVLFNVVAGAMAVPTDLKEASDGFSITGWRRFWVLYLPAIFPYLVTGWVTAAGGAWNASIVAEYVTYRDQTETTFGLGAIISEAAAAKQLPLLAAGVTVMSLVVVTFNRVVWRRLYRMAEVRFSLTK
jgi:NitT/TauT family transport system permease protein